MSDVNKNVGRFRLKGRGKRKPRGEMNRLESSFAEYLEEQRKLGLIEWWAFESIKFRIGNGAWFTPDFVAMNVHAEIVFYETKGFMRDAANVRLKVAASSFPFDFILVKKVNKMWTFKSL